MDENEYRNDWNLKIMTTKLDPILKEKITMMIMLLNVVLIETLLDFSFL